MATGDPICSRCGRYLALTKDPNTGLCCCSGRWLGGFAAIPYWASGTFTDAQSYVENEMKHEDLLKYDNQKIGEENHRLHHELEECKRNRDNFMDECNDLRRTEANLLNEQNDFRRRIFELEQELEKRDEAMIESANHAIRINWAMDELQNEGDKARKEAEDWAANAESLSDARDVLVDKAISSSKKLNVAEKMYKIFNGYMDNRDDPYYEMPLSSIDMNNVLRQWQEINDRVDVAGENDAIGDTNFCDEEGVAITVDVDSEEKWSLIYPDQVFNDAQLTLIKQMIEDATIRKTPVLRPVMTDALEEEVLRLIYREIDKWGRENV